MALPTYRLAGQSLDVPGCYRVADDSELRGKFGVRGGDMTVSQDYGVTPRSRIPHPDRRTLILSVRGDNDKDGNAHADAQQGLQDNLDDLYLLGKPALSGDGTVTLVKVTADGTERQTQVHVVSVDPGLMARATWASVAVDVLPVEGVWRDTTLTSASATDSFPLSVSNPGSADQFDSTITLSGDATSVTLSNGTWGPDTSLTVAVDLNNGDVTVDTGAMTAVQGSADVVGSVSHATDGAFPARWLPLLAGQDNSVGVSHDGTTLTVSVEHAARWL